MTTLETLAQYVAVVWRLDSLVEIRPLNGGTRRWVRASGVPQLADELERENAAGANVYAGVLPRLREGGTAADCAPGWVVWADFDGVGPAAAMDKCATSMPLPTAVVNSGHGAHLYWRLTEQIEPVRISALVRDMAVSFGSDPSVSDPARILRLPGFTNHKPPPAPCELLHVDHDCVYPFDMLRDIVPGSALPSVAPVAPAASQQSSDAVEERARRYIATVPGSGKGGRTRQAFKIACAIVRDFGLDPATALRMLEGWDSAANSPAIASDYPAGELAKIVANASKYGKKAVGEKRDAPPKPRAHPQSSDEQSIPVEQSPCGASAELEAEFAAEEKGERTTIPLPWSRLSDATHCLRPGTVTVIGGPAGKGKSILAMEMALYCERKCVPWAFLPLEDRRVDFGRRVLAHYAQSWAVIDDTVESAPDRRKTLETYRAQVDAALRSVSENPRLPRRSSDGSAITPACPYQNVLAWVEAVAKRARVLFIDPWTQIDFGDRDSWVGEKDFIRRLSGVTTFAGVSVVVVAHTVKRPGKAVSLPITGEDLQGAAELKRLTHTVLLLDAHEPREDDVYRIAGCHEKITHDRTLYIDKARNGSGGGSKFAFTMQGPHFEELGTICIENGSDSE